MICNGDKKKVKKMLLCQLKVLLTIDKCQYHQIFALNIDSSIILDQY